MAEFLYRLGRLAARHGWVVVGAWIGVLAIAAGGFAAGYGGLATSFDIPGTPSAKVIEELQAELPEFSGASGTVVFRTADGSALTGAQREQISVLAADAAGLPDVARVVDPFVVESQRAAQEKSLEEQRAQLQGGRAQLEAGQAQPGLSRAELDKQSQALEAGAELLRLSDGIRVVSEDGSTALVNVAFTKPRLELPGESKQAVIDHFTSRLIDGVEVAVSTDIAQGVPQIFGVGEAVGLAVAAVVLLVTLGTVIGAGIPIITAILGVAIGVLVAMAFSGVVQMASVTPVLGVMLGLAVGIDYSLFVVNRHRVHLRHGIELHESIGLANGTAGSAVVFAGSTVIVALLGLSVTGIPFLGVMGAVGAVCVGIAVLIAVTLTPALLGLVGERILRRRERAAVQNDERPVTEIRPMSTGRAIGTGLAAVAVLATIALPALSMRLGLPDGSSEPPGSLAQRAHTITETAFGPGANGPLLVTATLPAGLGETEVFGTQLRVASEIARQDHVHAVAPIAVSPDGGLAAFQVIPQDGPNSETTAELVRDLRELPPLDGDIVLGVAGQAAINIDISESLVDVLPTYLAVVVGLSLLILIVVFRSLLVPLIATGGFILSLFATYGAIVAVFQLDWLSDIFGTHATGPILNFLPIILVGVLFGLAMDYQLFLATGMREAYVHGVPARLAVAQGFRAGRAVVTAAGLIMLSVFGGFVFSESTIIRSLGFGLAFGVLVDAFVVRMLLVPAAMHLLGQSAWWLPRRLDRLLPNVDVEGAALERTHLHQV